MNPQLDHALQTTGAARPCRTCQQPMTMKLSGPNAKRPGVWYWQCPPCNTFGAYLDERELQLFKIQNDPNAPPLPPPRPYQRQSPAAGAALSNAPPYGGNAEAARRQLFGRQDDIVQNRVQMLEERVQILELKLANVEKLITVPPLE